MDLAELKTAIQQHVSDGLVLIVGSGLSCAEGLPGMSALAAHLETVLGPTLPAALAPEWVALIPEIKAKGLEQAFAEHAPSSDLEDAIRHAVGNHVLASELQVISEVFEGKRVLRLTKLLQHLLRPTSGVQVVTTNYDRLIEVAAEEAGLGVDTMFNGVFAGRLNESEARFSFCRDVSLHKNKVRYTYAERLVINKPHGSLDWYDRNGIPVRHCGDLPGASRLIIPPGQNKYRNGYNSPFDAHRERANRAIDRAARFLIVGYGFNDDHLETHLSAKIKSGTPTVLVTHSLSAKAKNVLSYSDKVMAIEDATVSTGSDTRVHTQGKDYVFAGVSLWDLNSLVTEVFEP